MKKKLRILSLLVLCLCALAGCECRHKWIEADCLTAKTCSKCEVTEGAPLGHDFAPATCESPETCTRCGLTQGEPTAHDFAPATCEAPETCTRCGVTQGETLPHTYGDWTLGETDMTHVCENCGASETTELDREVYLQQLLAGHWDFYGMSDNGQFYNAYDFTTDFLYYFSATANGGAVLYNGEEAFNYTSYTLEKFEETDGVPFYTFTLTCEDQTQVSGVVADLEDEDELYFFTSENSYFLLTKNRALASAVEGPWAAAANGRVYALTLNADRSFSGDLGGQVTGTWHLKPPYNSYGYKSSYITLRYTKDGEEHVESSYLDLGSADMTLEEYLQYDSLYLGFNLDDDTYAHYEHMSEEDFAVLEAAMAEGNQKLCGEWTSTKVYTWDSGSSTLDERNTTDYTITFAEDGTFTASLDQERSGTWEFQGATVYDGTASYSYYLYFDGVSDYVYAYTSTDAELYFSKSSQSGSTTIYFEQPNPEKAAAKEAAIQEGTAALVGTWNSLYISEHDSNTGSFTGKNVLNYTITFAEDGTFTASMDQEYTGTWEFSSLNVYEDENNSYTNYYFRLHFDGVSGDPYIFMSNINNSLSLNDDCISVEFCKMTAEEWDTLRKGLELPVGSWTVVSASRQNNKTQTENPLDASGCTLTVNADFTFSAALDTAISGSWYLTGYYPEYGSCYTYSLSNGTSNHYITLENGTLFCTIRDNAADTTTYYEMKRN